MVNNSSSSSLRKGAWTEEEDNLLRKCIHKFGEGKWHLVPFRAGLNRCRKSCRLRWLNYLRPNIKRGNFSSDEVDLIIRLHKLLGNRWSLIAGRLPGRTSNDVKNYWNTHLQKKVFDIMASSHKCKAPEITENTPVIKPQPRRFLKTTSPSSNKSSSMTGKITTVNDGAQHIIHGYTMPTKTKILTSPPPAATEATSDMLEKNSQQNNIITTLPLETTVDNTLQWWEDLFADEEFKEEGTTCMLEGQIGWSEDFPIDMDLVDLLS